MEYKFRAFIPQVNIMIYGVDVYANGTIGMTTDKMILPADYYIDWDSSCVMQTNPDKNGSDYHVMNVLQGEEYIWFYEGQYTLMQYTGLKDKNGVEIYQGDIVKFTDIPTGIESGEFEVIIDAGFIGIHANHSSLHLSDIQPHKTCEVIGNIYTNPELLNAK